MVDSISPRAETPRPRAPIGRKGTSVSIRRGERRQPELESTRKSKVKVAPPRESKVKVEPPQRERGKGRRVDLRA